LLKLSSEPYLEHRALTGHITEVDYHTNTFKLNVDDPARRITGNFSEEFEETLRRLGGTDIVVHITGMVEMKPDGRVDRVQSLDEIYTDVAHGMRIRIDQLLTLQPGWLGDQQGAALDHLHTERVRDLLETMVPSDAAVPAIFPTPDGGLEVEWTLGGWEVAVAFPISGCVTVSAVRPATGEEADQEFELEALIETDGRLLSAFLVALEMRA
jgi:hypothetical protein